MNPYNRLWFLFEKAWQSFCGMHCRQGTLHHPLCVEMRERLDAEKAMWKKDAQP